MPELLGREPFACNDMPKLAGAGGYFANGHPAEHHVGNQIYGFRPRQTLTRQPARALLARAWHFVAFTVRAVLKPGKARAMSSNAQRTRSSAVEHYVDIVGVTGSIPVVSTIKINDLAGSWQNPLRMKRRMKR